MDALLHSLRGYSTVDVLGSCLYNWEVGTLRTPARWSTRLEERQRLMVEGTESMEADPYGGKKAQQLGCIWTSYCYVSVAKMRGFKMYTIRLRV